MKRIALDRFNRAIAEQNKVIAEYEERRQQSTHSKLFDLAGLPQVDEVDEDWKRRQLDEEDTKQLSELVKEVKKDNNFEKAKNLIRGDSSLTFLNK